MRLFTIGLLSGAALLATACNKPSEGDAPADQNAGGEVAAAAAEEYFTVRAGPVSNAKITALAGNFQMLKVAAANGIPSDGKGGACLVFAAADLGFPIMAAKRCTKNSECKTGENGNDGKPASAYYCDGQTRSCWARPGSDPKGDDTCNKGITLSATDLNPVPKTPVDAAAKLGVKPGTKVRVVACLNQTGFIPPPNGTGCPSIDGPDRIEVFGPVATVKP